MINKKGQEEMVGFVLIVIIVTIALVVLMIFSLRKPSGIENSLEIENFLQASGYITTSCQVGGESLTIKKLIVDCKNKNTCDNGLESCDVLKEIFGNLLSSNWGLDYYKGHSLLIYSIQEGTSSDPNLEEEIVPIMDLKSGNQTGNFQGGDILFPIPPERFHIYLKIYY